MFRGGENCFFPQPCWNFGYVFRGNWKPPPTLCPPKEYTRQGHTFVAHGFCATWRSFSMQAWNPGPPPSNQMHSCRGISMEMEQPIPLCGAACP